MKHTSTTNTTLLIAACLVLAGCGKNFSCTASRNFSSSSPSSSASDVIVDDHRTITRTHDGVTRKLETTVGVDIQNGRITKFPKSALVKIQETGGSVQRQGELRENAGSLELWIKDTGNFRRGSPEDETWLERFLSDITTK